MCHTPLFWFFSQSSEVLIFLPWLSIDRNDRNQLSTDEVLANAQLLSQHPDSDVHLLIAPFLPSTVSPATIRSHPTHSLNDLPLFVDIQPEIIWLDENVERAPLPPRVEMFERVDEDVQMNDAISPVDATSSDQHVSSGDDDFETLELVDHSISSPSLGVSNHLWMTKDLEGDEAEFVEVLPRLK